LLKNNKYLLPSRTYVYIYIRKSIKFIYKLNTKCPCSFIVNAQESTNNFNSTMCNPRINLKKPLNTKHYFMVMKKVIKKVNLLKHLDSLIKIFLEGY
jgi:hypothetical protein